MFKKLNFLIVVALLFSIITGQSNTALASYDTTAPILHSLELDKTSAQPSDKISVVMEAEDVDSGITKKPVVDIRKKNSLKSNFVYLTYNETANQYEGTFTVPENAINGEWSVYWISLEDTVGNQYYLFPKEGNQYYRSFTVENGSEDTTQPQLKSIQLDKTTAQPGEKISIVMEAEDVDSGITKTPVVDVRKNDSRKNNYVYLTYNETANQYEGTFTVPDNAINGEWSVYWISLEDTVGNRYYLFPKEGNKFYRSFTVTNGNEDTAAPILSSLELDKTKVAIGDTINIRLEAEDIDSGITKKPVIDVRREGSRDRNYVYFTYNEKTEKYEGTFTVPENVIYGKWNVYWINIEDTVGNVYYLFPKEGNEFYRSFIITDDFTAPDTPTVNEVTDQSTKVTGKTEKDAKITVTVGTKTIGISSADENGIYSIPIPKQKAGTRLSITATDKSENESEIREVVVIDATAPEAPVVEEVSDQSDMVSGTAEANAAISVKVGGEVIGTGTVDENGKYEVSIAKQAAGAELIVVATDASGNESEAVNVTVKDRTAPAAPAVLEMTDQSTMVSGTAEANATITIKVGSKVIGTGTADENGKYEVSIPKQAAGTKLVVIATDTEANDSEAVSILVKDVTAPTLSLKQVTDKSTSIGGVTESKSKVQLYINNKLIQTTTANTNGSFTFKISKQKAGAVVKVVSSDSAGNKTTKSITVLDKTAPVLTIKQVTDKSTTVSGTTEAKATVKLYINNKLIRTTTANTKGVYSFTISKQNAGVTIKVTASDRAKNITTKTTKVVDKTAPSKAIVNKVTSNSTAITGKAEKSATVAVYKNKIKLGSTKVNTKGTFSLKISKQKKGTKLTVYVQDRAGNKSQARIVTVQ